MPRRVALAALLLPAALAAAAQEPVRYPKKKAFSLERSISPDAKECISCHKKENPGQFNDWAASAHAKANVTCIDCHGADKGDRDISRSHFEYGAVAISPVVTPKDCSRCHPDEAKEFARSKHANTLKIIWKLDNWLRQGMAAGPERRTGCYHCHGSVLAVDRRGELKPDVWPNVGVGRANLDGSYGSCSACHTRHRFSVAEARKPEACGQCHLGPDHPQIEIYKESKHGAIYDAEGAGWNWNAAAGAWTHGVDFRAPTCAVCHMSGAVSGKLKAPTTHDVTERLTWELQAPLTVRPSEFAAWPAKSHYVTEKAKMKAVCLQCHSSAWTDGHYRRMDEAVKLYNETYWKPVKKLMDALRKEGLVSTKRYFDDPIEFEEYEFWHHEGRRARMGAAMMAPDYAWWHGFYELKKRFLHIQRMAAELRAGKRARPAKLFPGATGSTVVPAAAKRR